MAKLDLLKQLKTYYQPSCKEVTVVDVPAQHYLMIDGKGDPNHSIEFKEAVETLFSMAYAIKFMVKKGESGVDYGVMPLEGLWWSDDMASFSVDHKAEWRWTLMIAQPEFVTRELYDAALIQVQKKKSLAAIAKLRFEEFAEGVAAQILHVGPFSAEGPTIEKLHNYIDSNGYVHYGRHHEIYLNDINKTTPEKLKTVIRQPMRR